MNRREFILLTGTAMSGAGMGRTDSASTAKPNILLILADDLSWCDAGCYGNPDVKTPNIDRLAGEGMRFTQAFTGTAMCAPTRQQLYTGVFPVRNGAYPNHSKVKPGTRSMVHHLSALGYRVGLQGKTHFGPKESFPFDPVKDLGQYTGAGEKPFCVVLASHHPHLPWPEPEGYRPKTVNVPEYLVDNTETREALCRYYTEVTRFDAQVGDALTALAAAGKEKNTIVIVTSEQGSPFPGGKWTCYDRGLRTQFIVRWPGVVKPGAVTDAMVQYVDVVPTLVELAGGDPETIDTGLPDAGGGGQGFDGRSFLAVLQGKADTHDEWVYGVHTTRGIIDGKPYPVRSVRDRRYKYIWNLMPDADFQNIVTESNNGGYWNSWVRDAAKYPRAAFLTRRYRHRPEEEFYDTQKDPQELKNLAGDPQYRGKMDEMRARLQAWMAQQGDKGIETELAVRSRAEGKD